MWGTVIRQWILFFYIINLMTRVEILLRRVGKYKVMFQPESSQQVVEELVCYFLEDLDKLSPNGMETVYKKSWILTKLFHDESEKREPKKPVPDKR